MQVKDTIGKLFVHVKSNEECSWPFIINESGKLKLAVFTYFVSETTPLAIYGCGRLLKTDGESVEIDNLSLFEKSEDFIMINPRTAMSEQERKFAAEEYYQELQVAVNGLEAHGKIPNISELAAAFEGLVPKEVIELYRKICPKFLETINE